MQVDLLTSSSPLKKKLTSQVAIEPRKLKDTFSFTELLTSLKRLYTISFQFSHHSCHFFKFFKKIFLRSKEYSLSNFTDPLQNIDAIVNET